MINKKPKKELLDKLRIHEVVTEYSTFEIECTNYNQGENGYFLFEISFKNDDFRSITVLEVKNPISIRLLDKLVFELSDCFSIKKPSNPMTRGQINKKE